VLLFTDDGNVKYRRPLRKYTCLPDGIGVRFYVVGDDDRFSRLHSAKTPATESAKWIWCGQPINRENVISDIILKRINWLQIEAFPFLHLKHSLYKNT